MWRLKFIILSLCLKEAAFQISCNKYKTCTDCISKQSGCSWCSLNEILESRCMPESTARERCPSDKLQAPESQISHMSNLLSEEFHIEPQNYHLKLRLGKPLKFDFVYKITKNNPVDVYFLIDASTTMKEIRDQTADQSENIYKALNNMTSDVKLGFGTFVDKNALPFVRTTDSSRTYSFKNRLNLTDDYEQFKELLKKYDSGTNYDAPEGGLDAVCQAIACKDVIGWRKFSAKIIVYLSNGPFHAAGDGRMAGIFTPYDGNCYTVNNVYTKELEMDYPTVSMVNKLAAKNEIKIIFAVNSRSSRVYKALSSAISGSKVILYDDSSPDPKLKETLSSIYKNITTGVNLKVNMKSGRRKYFNITFEPDCSKDLNKQDNNINEACKIKPNVDRNFNITGYINLLEYQEVDDYGIDIVVEGFSDKLSLDIKVIKTCDCESNVSRSEYCNGEISECGICKCSNGKYGEKCNCLAGSNDVYDNSTCINDKGDMCSGHGYCDCGLCTCYKGFEGRYCECIKTSCEMSNGQPCGGVDQGKCECGTCTCKDDYMGNACQCYKYDEACRRAPNEQICSGRGNCECGQCNCHEISKWEKRTEMDSYCTLLPGPSSHNLQCSYIEACVLCILKTNVTCPCEGLDIEEVSMKDMENVTDWYNCTDVRVDVGCYTKFLYKYNDDTHMISIQLTNEKNCAESHYIICGAVLGSLLLIGILTLIIWKVTTELSYRREYSKFVEAHKEDLAGTCENPLYESPTTHFRNPAFRMRSVN